jgi:hypothetical protein
MVKVLAEWVARILCIRWPDIVILVGQIHNLKYIIQHARSASRNTGLCCQVETLVP